MDEAEKIVMKASLKVTEEMKEAIKGISEIYKEFRKNGLSRNESLALVEIMLSQNRGE